MGGNDEREQTLNQLLTEMDGFDGRKGVVILAATNRPETLDKALLRPGRFDRRIPVELPDLKGREAILRVHGKDVKMDESVDFNAIARATVGASGAELANIINEGALRAVRMGRRVVSQADLEESVETVIAGYQKKMRPYLKMNAGSSLTMRSAMPWWLRARATLLRYTRSQLFREHRVLSAIRCRWRMASAFL